MNPTIAYITFRGMLGRRRAILLFLLPVVLLFLAVALRMTDNNTLDVSSEVLQRFALATLLPLLALIAGTGVIGPEIDDGQIMYVLTKPISRTTVVLTKLACAIVLVIAFAVIPTVIAALILDGTTTGLAKAFGAATLVGGITYSAIFVALAVVSRFAVTIGLIYAMVWESLIGNFAPGARTLSVQQWALSVAGKLTDASTIEPDLGLTTALIYLIVVTAGGALLASVKLRSLTIASAE